MFNALGVPDFNEGDSANVLGGSYYSISVFGILIKLELNSYDYEDDFKYMLSIRKDATNSTNPDETIVYSIAQLVRELLMKNLKIDIGQEEQGTLKIYKRL